MQMSDLHLYPFTHLEFIAQAIDLANSLAPDPDRTHRRLCLTCCWRDSRFGAGPGRLNARHGVHTVLGTHDHWTDAAVVRAGLQYALG